MNNPLILEYVQSPIAVRFRRWATQRLHEYIQKGFTMDDERLNPPPIVSHMSRIEAFQ